MEKITWEIWTDGIKCKCGGAPVVGTIDTEELFGARYRYVVMCCECSRVTTKCTNVCDAKTIWPTEVASR